MTQAHSYGKMDNEYGRVFYIFGNLEPFIEVSLFMDVCEFLDCGPWDALIFSWN